MIWRMRSGKKLQKTRIDIVGERYSGKTQLFISLNEGKKYKTVPSISNNVSKIKIEGKEYRLADYCGDDFSKDEVLTNIDLVHCIIHVVDGTDSSKLVQVASLIYRTLVNINFQKYPASYILFINKSDAPNFLGAAKI